MDGGMTVAHACRQIRSDIARFICILRDERMTKLANAVESAQDGIKCQVDTDKQHQEHGELSTLKGECMSVIHKNSKLAVIYYGKVDWKE